MLQGSQGMFACLVSSPRLGNPFLFAVRAICEVLFLTKHFRFIFIK